MTMVRLATIGACGLAGLLLLTGCGPTPDQLQIEYLQSEVNRLTAENDDLRSRLAHAISDRDAARARAYELERDLAQARREAAERPPVETGPTGWTEYKEFAWIELGTDVLFDSGKASLKAAGKARMNEIAGQISANYGDKMIWVIGHTDAEPIKHSAKFWSDNLDLSVNRAMTVFKELQKAGISPQRMVAGGQGEYNPVGTTDKLGRSKQNRRVQLVAVPMPPSSGAVAPAPSSPSEDTSSARPRDLNIK